MFIDKEYDKKYGCFDLEYVLKYAREVLNKYHMMQATYLVELARTAGMLGNAYETAGAWDKETESDSHENDASKEINPNEGNTNAEDLGCETRAPRKK